MTKLSINFASSACAEHHRNTKHWKGKEFLCDNNNNDAVAPESIYICYATVQVYTFFPIISRIVHTNANDKEEEQEKQKNRSNSNFEEMNSYKRHKT